MEITQNTVNGRLVLALGGQIDSTAAAEFEDQIVTLIAGGSNNIIVDFSKVKFISSAGLRVLLLAAKKVKPYGGKISLCNLSKDVKEVFEISGFANLFSIYESADEAIKNS
jgi:anti-sigma B factor antagonist